MPTGVAGSSEAYAALGELLIGADCLAAVGPQVLARLAGVFGWSLAELWLVHHDRASIRCEASWVSALLPEEAVFEFGATATFHMGRGFPGAVWESRRPWISDDLTADPDFLRKGPALALGLTGGLASRSSCRTERSPAWSRPSSTPRPP